MIEFSATFDIAYYRKNHPELAVLSEGAVIRHYREFAVVRGLTSCVYDRSEYMRLYLKEMITDEKILEIGAFDRPFCPDKNVKYFDVIDTEALKKRAVEAGRIGGKFPDKIDYVSPTGDLGIVDEKFDIVISSHVIEHQPDLIKHLSLVGSLLNDGGLYIMFVPDKRYCFDYFIPESTISETIAAYVSQQKFHSFKNVLTSKCQTVHNDPVLHWFGEHGVMDDSVDKFVKAIDEFELAKQNNEYIDAHAWQFTPESMGKIIKTLRSYGLIELSLHRLCHTIFGRQEFCVILKK